MGLGFFFFLPCIHPFDLCHAIHHEITTKDSGEILAKMCNTRNRFWGSKSILLPPLSPLLMIIGGKDKYTKKLSSRLGLNKEIPDNPMESSPLELNTVVAFGWEKQRGSAYSQHMDPRMATWGAKRCVYSFCAKFLPQMSHQRKSSVDDGLGRLSAWLIDGSWNSRILLSCAKMTLENSFGVAILALLVL